MPEMTSDVQVLVRRGSDIAEWFDTVAHLRAKVFRSFPYLYEGDIEYEKHYLSMYARSADSLLVLALADDLVVGASTGCLSAMQSRPSRCRSPIEESRWRQCFTAANQSCSRPSGAWPGPPLL